MEARLQVLSADQESGYAAWLALWQEQPEREVFAHPDYARLFARSADRVIALSLRSNRGTVLFPLILRPLAAEWWAGHSPWWDATTPYGYGGPFKWGAIKADEFWDAFDCWAASLPLVALFARRALFEEQLLPWRGELESKGCNVVRSLTLDEATLWMDYEHKVRKNVQKARRAGLRVVVDTEGKQLDSFLDVYRETMQRRNAEESYLFPRSFFEDIIQKLRGEFVFFQVQKGDAVVSVELVLCSGENLYSFLGGTREAAFGDRPNDLLKHEIILWGRAAGKRRFVLGGGYRPDDGIFRYKLSFAPRGAVPFFVGKRVFQPAVEAELRALRQSAELERGVRWTPRDDYFPAYRS